MDELMTDYLVETIILQKALMSRERACLSKLIDENNVQQVEALGPKYVFTDHDLLLNVKSEEMLAVLLRNGLNLNKCSWDALVAHRKCIVKFIMSDHLKVKVDLNSGASTHGMPIWRLLINEAQWHDVMSLKNPHVNCVEPLNLYAKDRDGCIFDYYTAHKDSVYDKDMRNYMKTQVLNERIDALEKKVSVLQKKISYSSYSSQN